MAAPADLIPVNVLTGYLGSGKTTLLRNLLQAPQLRDTAVLVNEFGEVGLDHHLLQPVSETALLLENGCVCCAIRGDLQLALRGLYSSRERGQIPYFSRIVVETSGLADPVPIAYTIQSEPVLQHHFRLGNIVTTVDTAIGEGQLDAHPESEKQAAIADRLVLTKTDLADPSAREGLRSRLSRLNTTAEIVLSPDPALNPVTLLIDDASDAQVDAQRAERWRTAPRDGGAHTAHRHDNAINSFTISHDAPLDWTGFGVWMTMLLHRHGDKVLRIKGMLNVAGVPGPVFINGVQHIVHPPTHLPAWPDEDRRSHIVFIVQGLDRAALENSLRVFSRLSGANRCVP